jgi:hypothetical protein
MLLATIICSDWECAEELEVRIEDLDKLDDYACDCGHGFALISVCELREEGDRGQLVELPRRRTRRTTRRAA